MSNLLTLDFAIVALYLLVTLIVGFVKGRGITTMEEYAIGDKKRYTTAVLVATLVATEVGASLTIGLAGQVFSEGMIWVAIWLLCIVNHLWISRYVAPLVGSFRGMISSGDLVERFYGKLPKVMTGIVGFFDSLLIIIIQIVSVCHIFQYFFDLPEIVSVVAAAELTTLYCF